MSYSRSIFRNLRNFCFSERADADLASILGHWRRVPYAAAAPSILSFTVGSCRKRPASATFIIPFLLRKRGGCVRRHSFLM